MTAPTPVRTLSETTKLAGLASVEAVIVLRFLSTGVTLLTRG